MKNILILMILTLSAFAQDQSGPIAIAACEPKDAKFDAKLDDAQHTIAQPDSGKALVYFI